MRLLFKVDPILDGSVAFNQSCAVDIGVCIIYVGCSKYQARSQQYAIEAPAQQCLSERNVGGGRKTNELSESAVKSKSV